MQNNQNELTGIPADAEKRKFTGIWIPAEIWNDNELPALAKLIYAEIASFGSAGCWKKTEALREPLGIGADLFQKLCRRLKEKGYIAEKRSFGRIIRTTTLGFQKAHQAVSPVVHQAVSPADDQEESPVVHIEYSKNKEKIKGADAPAKAVENLEKEKEEFGDPAINAFMKRWASATSNDCSNIKRERRAAHNLLKSQSKEGIDAIIAAVQQIHESGDQYAPSITLPSDLVGQYSKLSKLRLYVAKQDTQKRAKIKRTLVLDYDGLPPAYEVSEAERNKVKEQIKAMRESGIMPWQTQSV